MSERDPSVPALEDGVLRLDCYRPVDVSAHLAGEDEEQARRFGWFPRRSTEETVRAAIERWREEWRTGGTKLAWAARDTEGSLVGGCELRLVGQGVAHISYWIFPPFRGRGWASRAVSLVARHAFDALGLRRIEAHIEPDNLASRRTVEVAGFCCEGVLPVPGREQEGRRLLLYVRERDIAP
jgi:RimJ/RimL family protein N-acetyltransferase